MRKAGRTYLWAAAASLAIVGPLGAQQPSVEVDRNNAGVGTTSAEFLLMGAGARGIAIGPAYAAMARDVEALYYNPAGLPLMDGMQIGLTMMPYFADTNYLWAGFALPLGGGENGFGLSIGSFGFSDAPVYTTQDQNNESQLTYSVRETVLGLSFAHAFIDRFTGGVTAKLVLDDLGQTSATAVAFDVGTNYHAELGGNPISFSFVIQNLGTTLKPSGSGLNFSDVLSQEDPSYPVQGLDPSPARWEASTSPLPVVFRVGLAYDAITTAATRLSLLTEFNENYNAGSGFGAGAEWQWQPENGRLGAALRGSYSYSQEGSLDEGAGAIEVDNTGLAGLTFGGGLNLGLSESYQVKVDYAWRHFGALGSRNIFTVGLGWR